MDLATLKTIKTNLGIINTKDMGPHETVEDICTPQTV